MLNSEAGRQSKEAHSLTRKGRFLPKKAENKAKKREIGMLSSFKKRSKSFQPGAKVMFVLSKCSGVYAPPQSVWLLMLPKF